MTKIEKLFGSVAQVKIMRLFLLNPDSNFSSADIRKKTKVRSSSVRKTVTTLKKAGLIKSKTVKRKSKKTGRKRKTKVWSLNEKCDYITSLKRLLSPAREMTHREIENKLKGVGKVKLIVLSGVFINEENARVDLLVVGSKLKSGKLTSAIRSIESKVGSELAYAAMETDEFAYRHSIGDKLIRDILDYRYKKVLDKLNID